MAGVVVLEAKKTLVEEVAWAERGEGLAEFAAVVSVEGSETKFRRSTPPTQFLSREPLPLDRI